ncbi:MAG: putative nucleotidyltransferase substrate binding domain-containing protein [Candidatus Velamenicoccus archaeovorus]
MDVASFLQGFPPFDALDESDLARVVSSVQIEHFAPGAVVLEQGGEPARSLYVIRKGAVEILDDGRLVDLMTEGEAFGAWSLLGGFGPTTTVRAHEDTLCYLIPGEVAAEVLGTPPGLAFVMGNLRRRIERIDARLRSETSTERYRPVGSLIRRSPVTCEPRTTVVEAARLMARERISCLPVRTAEGWGIVTDRDLRTKIVAERRDPASTTVGEVMSYPAETVPSDAVAGEVLLRMLDGGYHHFPVRDERGGLLGVVTDTDLMGLGRDTPFALRSAIERAADEDAVTAAAREIPEVVAAQVEGGADPVDVGHMVALTIDALTRRLLELTIDRLGEPPAPWAWLALGSAARLEQALRTDQDHAFAFDPGGAPLERIDPYFAELAGSVARGLERAGIPPCEGQAMASNPALRLSLEGWDRQLHAWMEDPSLMGSVFLSIAFDFRQVAGPLGAGGALDRIVSLAPAYPLFLRHLARRGLDLHPPTGFFRDLVVESRGEHAGRLDVKHGGLVIVGNLARFWAIRAGSPAKRTIARLRAAEAAGAIDAETRDQLIEAFRFLWGIRLQHQVSRLRAGEPPDDFVDPAELGPVARRGLKESFRVIARAQRALALELGITR